MKILAIIISIILLITAFIDLHVGIAYYQILRWLVTIGAILCGIKYYQAKQQSLFIIFCIIAVLFNPIAPIYLGKSLWKIVDIIASIIFGISSLKISKNNL